MTGSDDCPPDSDGSHYPDPKQPGFLTRNLGWFPKPPRFKQDSACDRRAFQKRVEKRRKKKGYK